MGMGLATRLLWCVLWCLLARPQAHAQEAALAREGYVAPPAPPSPWQKGGRDVQLFAQSQPGAEVDSASLIVLDKIGKTPRDSLTVPDVHAANKWLCEAAGGVLDDDYRCSQSRVYSFSDKAALSDLRAHAAAIRSVFRAPGVRTIAGPRGSVQLVFLGLPYVEWGEEWNRQVSATQTYIKANRPQPANKVPMHFLRGTEILQIDPHKCDNCFYSSKRLPDNTDLLDTLLDFWHADCSGAGKACASAIVVVVDDADKEADGDLLNMLAISMWDQPLPDIKAKVLELCTDRSAARLATWAAVELWGAHAQTIAGALDDQDLRLGGLQHHQAGCKHLRDRYNARVRAFWSPRKVDYDDREEAVVKKLKSPWYQAMTQGQDVGNELLRAYRRRLGMEGEPPKKDLLDAHLEATDALLDAVQATVAQEARWLSHMQLLGSLATLMVDKWFWPGLYVGEKLLLTVSFALALPLVLTLGIVLLVRSFVPQSSFSDDRGARLGVAGGKAGARGVSPLRNDDEGRMMMVAARAKERLRLKTVAQIQNLARDSQVFLSPRKTMADDAAMYKSLKKEQVIQMLAENARLQNPSFLEKLACGVEVPAPSQVVNSPASGAVRKRMTEAERLLADQEQEQEVHIGSIRQGKVQVTIKYEPEDGVVKQVAGVVRWQQTFGNSGLLDKARKAFAPGARDAVRFVDGGNSVVDDDTTPESLKMEDDEMLQALMEEQAGSGWGGAGRSAGRSSKEISPRKTDRGSPTGCAGISRARTAANKTTSKTSSKSSRRGDDGTGAAASASLYSGSAQVEGSKRKPASALVDAGALSPRRTRSKKPRTP